MRKLALIVLTIFSSYWSYCQVEQLIYLKNGQWSKVEYINQNDDTIFVIPDKKKDIVISEQQCNWISQWCLLHLDKANFRTALVTESDTRTTTNYYALYLWFLVFALVTGFVSGILPALFVSKTKPIQVLKGINNIKLFSRVALRKILLVSQFTFSIIFL